MLTRITFVPVVLAVLLSLAGCADNPSEPLLDPIDTVVERPAPLHPVGDEEVDNGCRHDPNPIWWEFSCAAIRDATGWEWRVDQRSLGTVFSGTTSNPVFKTALSSPPPYLDGWSWMVRVKVGGRWSQWCNKQTFRVEPLDTDCITGVTLYEHLAGGGRSQFFNMYKLNGSLQTAYPDLHDVSFNDIATSLRLHNIKGVWLYEHTNYQGRYQYFTSTCNDLRPYALNDRVSSLRIDP